MVQNSESLRAAGDNHCLTIVLPSRNDVVHLNEIIEAIVETSNDVQVVLVDSGSEEIHNQYMRALVSSFVDEGIDISLVISAAGIGSALTSGFQRAKFSTIAWFPTDGQLSLDVLRELCRFRLQGSALIVVRENYEQISGIFRRALTAWNHLLINFLLGIRFRQFNGAFVMPVALVKLLPIGFKTAALNWALLHSAIQTGLTINELPATIRKRDVGRSRITKIEFFKYPFELMKYAWSQRDRTQSLARMPSQE
jgi:hypothetical protein